MRTFEDYAAFYEKHAGELQFNPRFKLYFEPEHGFCEFGVNDKFLFVGSMAGDLDYWINKAKDICKADGLKSITTFTARNIKAYIRRIGFKIDRVEDENGYTDYYGRNKDRDTLHAEQIEGGYILTWTFKR